MIGVFDSGVGGLSVLRELVKQLPGEQFIFYADNANCPYGRKSASFIIERARAISKYLMERGCDMIVIACNTATAAAIATLRADYPEYPFVGIEPAIKPAAASTTTGVVGVLATHGTLTGEKYHIALGKLPEGIKVVEHVGDGFVELVESGTFEGPEAEEIVRKSVEPLLEAGADTLVLGCTHYPFLAGCISKIAAEWCSGHDSARKVSIIDPSPAVARQACRLRAANTSGASTKGSGSTDGGFGELDSKKIIPVASGDSTLLVNLINTLFNE